MPKKQYQSRFQLLKIEETIRLFDSFGSVYQVSEPLLQVFEELLTPRLPLEEDYRTLVAYIGATWAKMLHAVEITCDLPWGKELYFESREIVDVATERWRRTEVHPVDEMLPPLVLTRWLDITAKLFYFSGDHSEAKHYWDLAEKMLEDKNARCIGFLKADILSSRLRNLYEMERIVTGDTSVSARKEEVEKKQKERNDRYKNKFQELITKSIQELSAYDIPSNSVNTESVDKFRRQVVEADWQDRGRLRGLANLYQNSDEFEKVRIIATALQDELRLHQSYHAEAGKVWDKTPGCTPARAAYLWKLVRDGEAWQRGILIARQHLARLDKLVFLQGDKTEQEKFWVLLSVVEELINVIDAIQDRDEFFCGRRPSYAVRDIELHGWTVRFALDVLEELEQLCGQPNFAGPDGWADLLVDLQDRMYQECVQMVRSHRGVIKIATFKTAYAQHYDRAYKRVYRHLVTRRSAGQAGANPEVLRAAVQWIEESSARDFLDAVAAARNAGHVDAPGNFGNETASWDVPPENTEDLSTKDQEGNKKDKGTDQGDGHGDEEVQSLNDSVLTCEVLLWNNVTEEAQDYLRRSYSRFEAFARDNPQAPQEIRSDLFDRLCDLAAAHDCYFVRFAERWDSGFDVYVFRPDKHVRHYPVLHDEKSIERLQDRLHNLLKTKSTIPAKGDTKATPFDSFVEPLSSLADCIGQLLLSDIAKDIDSGKRVFVVPTGWLWQIPLHIGKMEGDHWFERNQIFYTASLAALLEHDRIAVLQRSLRLRRGIFLSSQGVKLNKDTSQFEKISSSLLGKEIFLALKKVCEKSDRLFWGPRDKDWAANPAEFPSLDWFKKQPEVLCFGCHGKYVQGDDGAVHPILQFDGPIQGPANKTVRRRYITPYDLAMAAPISNSNVLTIFGACVSGQAAARDGGEVSGFLRAAVGAGAGVCLMTFWPVLNSHVNSYVENLLDQLNQNKSVGDALASVWADKNPDVQWYARACFASFL